MLIAVPLAHGVLSRHFGRSDGVAVYEADLTRKTWSRTVLAARPKGACESLPAWLKELGVERVLVVGLGQGAVQRLNETGIAIAKAADLDGPDDVIAAHIKSPVAGPEHVCSGHEHDHQHCRSES